MLSLQPVSEPSIESDATSITVDTVAKAKDHKEYTGHDNTIEAAPNLYMVKVAATDAALNFFLAERAEDLADGLAKRSSNLV